MFHFFLLHYLLAQFALLTIVKFLSLSLSFVFNSFLLFYFFKLLSLSFHFVSRSCAEVFCFLFTLPLFTYFFQYNKSVFIRFLNFCINFCWFLFSLFFVVFPGVSVCVKSYHEVNKARSGGHSSITQRVKFSRCVIFGWCPLQLAMDFLCTLLKSYPSCQILSNFNVLNFGQLAVLKNQYKATFQQSK